MLSTPVALDRSADLPLYRQIEEELRAAILDGRLRPGMRLPSVRALAAELRVARITVVTAYEQLAAEGYVEGRAGVGTIVAEAIPDEWRRRAPVPAPSTPPVAGAADRRGQPKLPPMVRHVPQRPFFETHPALAGRAALDLSTAGASFDRFPTELWERTLKQAWRELTDEPASPALTYRGRGGDMRLRAALAGLLGATRAVRCEPEDVLIASGSQGAIGAIARLWLAPGRRFVAEDPGAPHLWRTLLASGARMLAVPVDADGLVVDALPEAAELVLVTPSWQYPAGGTLPLARRIGLLEWAHRSGAVIVEDDCDSELRYSGHPLASLQGLDQDGRVIYTGTFSKVLFPGLRTGFAVAPRALRSPLLAALEAHERGPAALEQRALAIFIEEGHFERHLRRLRHGNVERQAALRAAVARHLDGLLSVSDAPAGTHLVARIDHPCWTASELATAARSADLIVEPLSLSRVAPSLDRELLLHYAGHRPVALDEAMRRLGAVMTRPIDCAKRHRHGRRTAA
jgi:GntR family transcriptional regulator/MocR family aminotransferase